MLKIDAAINVTQFRLSLVNFPTRPRKCQDCKIAFFHSLYCERLLFYSDWARKKKNIYPDLVGICEGTLQPQTPLLKSHLEPSGMLTRKGKNSIQIITGYPTNFGPQCKIVTLHFKTCERDFCILESFHFYCW